jgi:hypothetical protein
VLGLEGSLVVVPQFDLVLAFAAEEGPLVDVLPALSDLLFLE